MCASATPPWPRIASSRASFLELIDKDPAVVIYGVTTAMGERASHRLDPRGARPACAPQAVRGRDLVRRLLARSRGARHRVRAAREFPRGPRRHDAAHRASRGGDARRRTHAGGARRRPGRRGRDTRALSLVRRARRPLRARGEGARLADQRLALRGGAHRGRGHRRAAPHAARNRDFRAVDRCVSRTARALRRGAGGPVGR